MRLAVFTSQFPGRINTFFARDMRALLDAGIEVEVFPLYPLDAHLWAAVPDWLDAGVLPRSLVHHVDVRRAFTPGVLRRLLAPTAAGDLLRIAASALPFGAGPAAKSVYAVLKGSVWARQGRRFDHVMAYWGNYAATAAYVFHRLTHADVPFSMFLHAGTDLYRDQVFLREKLEYADNVVVVCEFNRSFLKRLYPDLASKIDCKISTHHLPLDLSEYAFEPEGRLPDHLLAVGSLEASKGFETLLRAAALLTGQGLELEIKIIGDGPQRASLVPLARQLGLGDRIAFAGWQSPTEVRLAMQKATMLVHPSSGLGDAVPTVIKEALALGTPTVASDVAGIPELLDRGRCGMLVPPGNPELLANAITRLLQNPVLRAEYARAGRRHAETMFDIRRNGPRLASLLRNSVRAAKTGFGAAAVPTSVSRQ